MLTRRAEALGCYETWLKDLADTGQRIPQSFDSNFVTAAFDIILESDHHQLVSRTLGILYTYAELFEGELRRKVPTA